MNPKIKRITLALLLFATMGAAGSVHAAPYQFQVSGSFAQAKSEAEGFFRPDVTVDTHEQSIGLTFYLSPVDANAGPIAERAFLSKSAWLSGFYGLSEVDSVEIDAADADGLDVDAIEAIEAESEGVETNSIIVNTRFIIQSDFIVELDYLDIDDSDDDVTYSLGVGKYMDGNTTALLKASDLGDDAYSVVVNYKKLSTGGASGTSSVFSGGIGYVDFGDSGDVQLNFDLDYYFSDNFSVGAGLLVLDDLKTYTLSSDYFLTDSIFGGVSYLSTSVSDFLDSSVVGLTIGARF